MPDYARTWGSVLVVVATLYFGRAVLLPVALSILLTFLLSPLVTWLLRVLQREPADAHAVRATAG